MDSTDRLTGGVLLAGSPRIRPNESHYSAGLVWGKSWGSATTMTSNIHTNQQPGADPELQVQNIE
jgi:hypothetical protein